MENNFPEWVKKAESDWRAVRILYTSPNRPNDIIAFHCQQMAEKYLKAFLIKKLKPFAKSHDLEKLFLEVEKYDSSVSLIEDDLSLLNEYSILPRYPGDFAEPTGEDVDQAFASAKRIRYFFRKILRLNKKKQKKK